MSKSLADFLLNYNYHNTFNDPFYNLYSDIDKSVLNKFNVKVENILKQVETSNRSSSSTLSREISDSGTFLKGHFKCPGFSKQQLSAEIVDQGKSLYKVNVTSNDSQNIIGEKINHEVFFKLNDNESINEHDCEFCFHDGILLATIPVHQTQKHKLKIDIS